MCLRLKVCGLTIPSQIQSLIEMKVDFLGFIFYPKSPRYVLPQLSLKQISKINHNGKVGVFVNESIECIVEISKKAQLNFIQLHGDEDLCFIRRLKEALSAEIKIIKVIRVGEDLTQNQIIESDDIHFYLFDTDSKAFGGTGKSFDWQLLNNVYIPKPYLLSGGINTENYKQIVALKQKPFALDVNSKFENNPGDKNILKIKEFTELKNNDCL